jgi:DNA-binding SARP family transcriptional activator
MIEFALLGALIRSPSGSVRLGPPKQRQVLVRLLIGRNQVVATSDLIDELWPDRPPSSSATANLRMYVANLRRSFVAADPGRPKPALDVARVPSG